MTNPQPTQIGGEWFYTAAQVAALFDTTTGTVRRWCRDGRFPGGITLPEGKGAWLIPAKEADRELADQGGAIPGYSTIEIMARFEVSRSRVGQMARDYGWPIVGIGGQTGRMNYYARGPVDKYAAAR